MAWNSELSNLRNMLAGIYWTQNQAYQFVQDVGINPIYIGFDIQPIITWQNILQRALNEGLLERVIAKAREENPGIQALALAQQQQLHLAVTTPTLPDEAWRGPIEAEQLEKIIGAHSTLRPINFLQRGVTVSRSVVRIVRADKGRGTGFLIANNLLLTNHHVLDTPAIARGAKIEFNYQKMEDGVDATVEAYALTPDKGFATSPLRSQGGDDWTIVRVAGDANSRWGALPLQEASPQVQDEVIIIQHPMGGTKQIALSHNTVAYVDAKSVQYLTDTLEGSSGSPVFNLDWQVVALHQMGGWIREPNSKQAVYRNQGIHVNVLLAGLQTAGLA